MRKLTDLVAETIVAEYGTDLATVVVNDEVVGAGLE